MRNRLFRSVPLLLSALLLGASLFGFLSRQSIYDWMRLREYTPPAPIAQLATNTAMNVDARRLFYVYHPELNDKTSFNANCKSSESTIVLGCYVDNLGIYIYDVQDDRLAGIEEVTAAHEMLHAAYHRLSDKERNRVDGWLQTAYGKLTNERIRSNIDEYRAKDPSVVSNELHSILGTEVADLSPELERYYKKYFTDRQKVVGFAEQYEAAFTVRLDKIEEYDATLKDSKSAIEALQKSVQEQAATLRSRRITLDGLLANKEIEAYNLAVPNYNFLVRSYNEDVSKLQTMIDEYNDVVVQRNALATEENELYKAIDSRPETIEVQ